MRSLQLFSVIIILGLSALWITIPSGCATIIPPGGGPRDSFPPVLLEADPPDSSVNFSGNSITLTFDEYVDLKDVSNNVFFTPTFQNSPPIRVQGKSITIDFKDSKPEPNTTYVINFNNAIVDVNESNVLRGYNYAFSTGPVLDSLQISGRVLLAETGGLDTTILVVLYRDFNDSSVVNKKAPYITNLNSQGYFSFKYLPSENFAIYALGGSQKDRRYDSRNFFAFSGEPAIAGQTDSLVLYAFKPVESTASSQSGRRTTTASDSVLRYALNTVSGQHDILNDLTITFPTPLDSFDSTLVSLSTDSLFNPVPFSSRLDTSRKMISISSDWLDSTAYNLVLQPGFAIDTAGRQTPTTDTARFTTRPVSEYGQLAIRFRDLDLDLNPVLQFVQNNTVVYSAPLTDALFTRALFAPGEYNLRILFDENGDGKWTTGSFFGVKRQPELVFPVERTITVKPSWKNEFEIPLLIGSQ